MTSSSSNSSAASSALSEGDDFRPLTSWLGTLITLRPASSASAGLNGGDRERAVGDGPRFGNALSERVRFCGGRRLPHYFFFMFSGMVCDVVQYFIDLLIRGFYVWDFERAAVCWMLSYTASIVLRHTSHRLIVFGEFEGAYFWALGKTYLSYSSSIVISTLTNHFLVEWAGLTQDQAWIVTLLWTGVYNYFMLRTTWSYKKKKADRKDHDDIEGANK